MKIAFEKRLQLKEKINITLQTSVAEKESQLINLISDAIINT